MTKSELASKLQSRFHECLLILGRQDNMTSFFSGSHEDSLSGKVAKYGHLRAGLIDMSEMLVFNEFSMRFLDSLDTWEELVEETQKAFDLIREVCKKEGIDGYTGEILR
jgi:hypothetical protein